MLKIFILSLIVCCPKHALNKDAELLDQVVSNFEAAGEKYNLEPSLLAYQAYKESSFQPRAEGSLGEKGFAQAHGLARKTCEAVDLDVETIEGGIHCLALLLDMGRRRCGSLLGAMNFYASGKCKSTVTTRAKMEGRLRAWRRKWEALSNE